MRFRLPAEIRARLGKMQLKLPIYRKLRVGVRGENDLLNFSYPQGQAYFEGVGKLIVVGVRMPPP